MVAGCYVFDRFVLDTTNRTLRCDGVPVEVSTRYLDALILLVAEAGRLVSKDRFHQEVWRGVPVTDEALTQCIKTLRRQLGDDAARPHYIVTVPKHGYRFIGQVQRAESDVDRNGAHQTPDLPEPAFSWRAFFLLGGAGTLGAAGAGAAGGLFYGSVVAAQQPITGAGGVSGLLVLVWLTIVTAMVGGAGVSFGIAGAGFARARGLSIVGGALGGMIVGGAVKLLGLDAFNLLLGHAPGAITGAPEGALLGGAVGLGAWLSGFAPPRSLGRAMLIAGAAGCVGAVLIWLLGGRLMGGSLDLLAQTFPGSRLRLDQLGQMVGENSFGPRTRLVTGALEGTLFGAFIVGAMRLARRTWAGVK